MSNQHLSDEDVGFGTAGAGGGINASASGGLSDSAVGFAPATDGPLARGWNKAKQSMAITSQLATGDAAGAARTIRQADDYARANPGMPEGTELSQAWQRGDGVTGGVAEVGGEFAKDWRESPGVMAGIRATGRNLRALGEGVVEQVPNMIAPTIGMVAGGLAGAAAGSAAPVVGNVAGGVAGAWAGGAVGNTLVEGGGQAQDALQKAGINPQDAPAVERYLKEHGDTILGQSAQKGAIISAVDVLTAGIGGKLLTAPARAATSRALADMGVDVADKAAVKAAMQTPDFAARIADDAVYQASRKGAGNAGRHAAAAALEPAGEFTGEYVGQGVATGDWDAKNATLEALSSIGQSGAMFAGQKAYQIATQPAGTKARAQALPHADAAAEDADAIYPSDWQAAQQPFDPQTGEPVAAPEAPEFTTSAGAGVPVDGNGMDFELQVDTSGLEALTPEQLAAQQAERARGTIDFQPEDAGPNWSTEPGAQAPRQGLDVPAPEIDTGGLDFEQPIKQIGFSPLAGQPVIFADGTVALSSEAADAVRAAGLRPSQALGIDASAGPLAAAAAQAIDTGATTQLALQKVQASAQQSTIKSEANDAQQTSARAGFQGQTLAAAARGEAPAPVGVDAAQATGLSGAGAGGGQVQAAGVGAANNVAARAQPTSSGGQLRLQNRDRSSAASVAQMNSIAANPDYLRTGPSRTMDQGAPVVFGDVPKSAVMGRQETVADGRGGRVRVQYAVVDAADVVTSHRADGSTVAEYETGVPGKLRAVAGNGRAAGLAEAYRRGRAQPYKQEMLHDAESVGVDWRAISGMEKPVLVRVMAEQDVTPDIGDRSNTVGTQRLSPTEEAANDAARVDLSALQFTDDGRPLASSINGFVQSMPESERGDMMNADGTPTRQAVDRLMAAVFKQAYDSDALVQLYAQATDPEARTVMTALADAAGAMAGLRGHGEFDVRAAVADAASMAVNATRQGLRLADVLKNRDLDMSPEAFIVAEFMAANIRSGKRMADGLRNMAQRALEQVQIARDNETQAGMFGKTPTLSRQQILESLNRGQTDATAFANTGRAGPAARLAQSEGADAAPTAGGRADRAERGGQREAGQAEGVAPSAPGWRTNYLQAAQVARGLGIDPRQHKNTADLVSAIDATSSEQTAAEQFPSVQRSEGATSASTANDEGARRAEAVQDFKAAMADLADVASRWSRAALIPESDPQVMQALARLFDAAIRIVGTDLQQAIKWVKQQLRAVPSTRGLANKIDNATMRKAAEQALAAMDAPVQGGLFDGVEAATQAVQAVQAEGQVTDEFTAAAPQSNQGDGGRQRFTLTIPLFGEVPYRASAPVDSNGDEVVSSRVITANTKLTERQGAALGLPRDKKNVLAWRVSVLRGPGGGAYSVIEAMTRDHGRTADGEVVAYFQRVADQDAVSGVAPRVAKAAMDDWQAAQSAAAPGEGAPGEQRSATTGRLTPDEAAGMRSGDMLRDDKGNEYIALSARHKWLEAAPIADGKPQVSKDTVVTFHLEPESASAYPERRADPIYPLGRNFYEPEAKAAEQALFSRRAPDMPRNLVALHNLTADNLLAADRMGGIPVPSIGVTKVDSPFDGFGDVTLIGPKGMIDPEAGVPVFDRDAYTARFPTMNFKRPKAKVVDALYARTRDAIGDDLGGDARGFLGELWDALKNDRAPSPEKVVQLFERYRAPRLQYLRDVMGKTVKMPMRDQSVRYPFSKDKALNKFILSNEAALLGRDDISNEDYSAAIADLADEVRQALDRFEAQMPELAGLADDFRRRMFDADGLLVERAFRSLIADAKAVNVRVPDEGKFKDAIDKALPPDDAGYRQWVRDQVEPLFDAPTITLRGRQVEPTLDNIVAAMTIGATAGAEKTTTSGPGKTAAMLGKRFKSIAQIQAARDQVVTHEQEEAGKKSAEAILSAYQAEVAPFFKFKNYRGEVDTWAALDASMEALATAGKAGATDAAIKSALRRHDFVDPSQAVVDLARRAIDALRQSPTNYFEAKPQRAVKLSEFRGAVVPKGLPAAARDVLERAGVQVVEYNPRTQGARAKAIATLTTRLDKPAKDVLFSRSAATREAYESRIDELFAGRAANRVGVKVLDRSDVLGLLGYANKPVILQESKVVAGQDKHPNMTAAVWKKVPAWLDDPAAVFKSDTVKGRLVFVAPEPVAGAPMLMIVDPTPDGKELKVSLLVNAYDAQGGQTPFRRWLSGGMALYADKKKFPALLAQSVGLQLPDTALQNKPGMPRILTEKNLAGWRKANDASLARYSFAGQRAATAERHALASAEQRIAAGEDAEAVRQDTGWHKGSDGKWRFEINDADAKLALAPDEFKAFASAGGTVRLGDVLDHPALFAAYPALADMPVGVKPGGGASYSSRNGQITMGESVPDGQFRSVLMHEIQHGIQTIEGFATGGAVSRYHGDIYAQRDQYRREAGEVEARNVQARLDMTPAERRAFAPEMTQDVETGDQVVSFNGKVAASAPTPANALDMRAYRQRLVEGVQSSVDQIKAKWKNAPEVVVVHSMEDEKIPERVREADASQRSQGATGEPEGFFYQGKVYVVASQMHSRADVARVLMHETLGHYGLRGVFGKSLDAALNQLSLARWADVIARAREYGLVGDDIDVNTATDAQVWASMSQRQRLEAAEEVLAFLAQTEPQLSFVQRAIAAIRTWLRENVPALAGAEMSDAEVIRNYILPARAFVERGRPSEATWLIDSARFSLRSLISQAAEPGNTNHTVQIAKVSDATARAILAAGLGDVSGYAHTADLFALRHIMKEHSSATEKARGQLPVTAADIEAIGEVVSSPDKLILGQKNKIGRDVVISMKRMADGTKLYVEEISTGGKALAAQSLRKYPATTPDSSIIEALRHTRSKPASRGSLIVVEGSDWKQSDGHVDQGDADIRFSRAAPAQPTQNAASWNMPEPSRFDDIVYRMQDKHIDMKRVVEAIAKSGQQLREENNAYRQEELFHGRVAKRVEDFQSGELTDVLEAIKASGMSLGDVEEFLHARHAKEANALIAQRDPSMPDGGSGMTNAAADAYMKALPAADRAKLEKVAALVDGITAATRQLYADYGLESQATVDGWGKMFQYYVPLQREDTSSRALTRWTLATCRRRVGLSRNPAFPTVTWTYHLRRTLQQKSMESLQANIASLANTNASVFGNLANAALSGMNSVVSKAG